MQKQMVFFLVYFDVFQKWNLNFEFIEYIERTYDNLVQQLVRLSSHVK